MGKKRKVALRALIFAAAWTPTAAAEATGGDQGSANVSPGDGQAVALGGDSPAAGGAAPSLSSRDGGNGAAARDDDAELPSEGSADAGGEGGADGDARMGTQTGDGHPVPPALGERNGPSTTRDADPAGGNERRGDGDDRDTADSDHVQVGGGTRADSGDARGGEGGEAGGLGGGAEARAVAGLDLVNEAVGEGLAGLGVAQDNEASPTQGGNSATGGEADAIGGEGGDAATGNAQGTGGDDLLGGIQVLSGDLVATSGPAIGGPGGDATALGGGAVAVNVSSQGLMNTVFVNGGGDVQIIQVNIAELIQDGNVASGGGAVAMGGHGGAANTGNIQGTGGSGVHGTGEGVQIIEGLVIALSGNASGGGGGGATAIGGTAVAINISRQHLVNMAFVDAGGDVQIIQVNIARLVQGGNIATGGGAVAVGGVGGGASTGNTQVMSEASAPAIDVLDRATIDAPRAHVPVDVRSTAHGLGSAASPGLDAGSDVADARGRAGAPGPVVDLHQPETVSSQPVDEDSANPLSGITDAGHAVPAVGGDRIALSRSISAEELPFTGLPAGLIALVGALLAAGGGTLRRSVR